MSSLKILFFIFALWIQNNVFSQTGANSYDVKLVLHTVVGSQPLLLDSNYVTPLGDTFSVSKFKFIIGKIGLSCSDYEKIGSGYFLVDQIDTNSQQINVGRCDSLANLSFIIGVDSVKNVSGVQTGALDPANGMFWTWNSGYIMAKLEGKSPQSKAPFGNITYHVGGFRQKDNAVRKVLLSITIPNVKKAKDLNISNATNDSRHMPHEIKIDINVDLNKWFDGPHPIKISEKSFCMSPGKMAIEIADNYANMFSIKNISVK